MVIICFEHCNNHCCKVSSYLLELILIQNGLEIVLLVRFVIIFSNNLLNPCLLVDRSIWLFILLKVFIARQKIVIFVQSFADHIICTVSL